MPQCPMLRYVIYKWQQYHSTTNASLATLSQNGYNDLQEINPYNIFVFPEEDVMKNNVKIST